jgi:serine/threonine protein kinase
VDTWAFGCVVYNLVMLEPPFTGDNLISLGMNIVNSAPKEFPQRYTNRLSSLVFKALEKIPVIRPSISEIIRLYFFEEPRQVENTIEPKLPK